MLLNFFKLFPCVAQIPLLMVKVKLVLFITMWRTDVIDVHKNVKSVSYFDFLNNPFKIMVKMALICDRRTIQGESKYYRSYSENFAKFNFFSLN